MLRTILILLSLSLAGHAVAAPLLIEENVEALTTALNAQGFDVREIAIDDKHYEVVGEREGAAVRVLVSETYEIIEVIEIE